MIKELVLKNRTYRRFHEKDNVEMETLVDLVDVARVSSSGRNAQPLKYILVNGEETRADVFKNLRWAGALKDWDGPVEGERPTAYIIMLMDKKIANNCFWDHGIACENILLAATEIGLGGCMFASFDKKALTEYFGLEDMEILMVLALGNPKEKVELVEMENDEFNYYRDSEGVHYVPKRSLEEIIVRKL